MTIVSNKMVDIKSELKVRIFRYLTIAASLLTVTIAICTGAASTIGYATFAYNAPIKFLLALASCLFVLALFIFVAADSVKVSRLIVCCAFLLGLMFCMAFVLMGFIKLDLKEAAVRDVQDAWLLQKEGKYGMAAYQILLECCGIESIQDYRKDCMVIPISCYKDRELQKQPHNVGCLKKVLEDYNEIHDWLVLSTRLALGVQFLTLACVANLLAFAMIYKRDHPEEEAASTTDTI